MEVINAALLKIKYRGEQKLTQYLLTEEDMTQISTVNRFLTKLEIFSTTLGGDQYVTSSALLPVIAAQAQAPRQSVCSAGWVSCWTRGGSACLVKASPCSSSWRTTWSFESMFVWFQDEMTINYGTHKNCFKTELFSWWYICINRICNNRRLIGALFQIIVIARHLLLKRLSPLVCSEQLVWVCTVQLVWVCSVLALTFLNDNLQFSQLFSPLTTNWSCQGFFMLLLIIMMVMMMTMIMVIMILLMIRCLPTVMLLLLSF